MISTNSLALTNYRIHKQFFKLFGGAFRIYDPAGNLCFFADMKAFKLKEDLTLFSDEAKTNAVLSIKARHIIDFSAIYDVTDPNTGEKAGAFKRKGLKSILKDEWIIMDSLDQEIGLIKEDSALMATLRRFVTDLIPQKFHGEVRGFPVFKFTQNFNPFTLKMELDFTSDSSGHLDRRMGLAAAVLICAIEGRQKS